MSQTSLMWSHVGETFGIEVHAFATPMETLSHLSRIIDSKGNLAKALQLRIESIMLDRYFIE
jgi:hypothetical protein